MQQDNGHIFKIYKKWSVYSTCFCQPGLKNFDFAQTISFIHECFDFAQTISFIHECFGKFLFSELLH